MMAIWDKLRKKKAEPEKSETPEIEKEVVTKKEDRSGRPQMLGVLLRPRVTEKTAKAGEENKYVFVASKESNKIDIKKAVEARYGVSVADVNIANIFGKERRRGRQIGWKQGYKKAIVTLKEGQNIEIQ